MIHVGYEVDRLERVLRQEEQRHRELEVEAAYLASPQQISARATNELGMVPAELDRLVFREDGQ